MYTLGDGLIATVQGSVHCQIQKNGCAMYASNCTKTVMLYHIGAGNL